MNKWPHKHPKGKRSMKRYKWKEIERSHTCRTHCFFFFQLSEVGVGDEYPREALVFIDDICLDNIYFSPDRLVAKS
jgi:hypothetical protein